MPHFAGRNLFSNDLLKENDLRKEIDMAIGRFGPEAQVEKRILRSSDPAANYELDFQCLSPTSNVQCQHPPSWHSIRRLINS